MYVRLHKFCKTIIHSHNTFHLYCAFNAAIPQFNRSMVDFEATNVTITIHWEEVAFDPQLKWSASCILLCNITAFMTVSNENSVLTSTSLSLAGLSPNSLCSITITGIFPDGFTTEPLIVSAGTISSSKLMD